ncbi:FAD-dependent thymidylate synthase [Candidatus Microgenomates bacterium]|nr:FAD-dependent thymidylate synthase [Candidatus Microgenomates bacterium]
MHRTSDLKLDFLGWIPRFEDQFIDSQSIIAFSALLSFKGRQSVKTLFKEALVGEGSVSKKVKAILRKSSLRGHASLSTTPALAISFQGSKFLDSLLTGTVFSSSLMSSGRRAQTSAKDIVFPDNIYIRKETRFLYQKQMEKNIDFLNKMLANGIPKDAASKIMPYGLVGTGTLILPIESIIGFERELEHEKEWMPEDAVIFLNEVKKKLKKFGLDDLYHTRKAAPRNVYHFPNIFKNPKTTNMAQDFSKGLKPAKLSQIVSFEAQMTPNFRKRLKALNQIIKNMATSKRKIKNQWLKVLLKRKELCRDYSPAVALSMISSVSWRVWGEKKRHRTVPQVVDSIYASVERASRVFKKAYPKIKTNKIEDKLLKEIDFVFAVPPAIVSDKKILASYLKTVAESLFTYEELIKKGIPARDAIYVIPRGIRILVLQNFDLYNLITGYYPLRLCPTAEEQMKRRSEVEWLMIKRVLEKRGLEDLLSLIVPKCHLAGFCPEQKSCGKIKALVPYYNEEFHQEMKEELEKKFLESKKGDWKGLDKGLALI